MPEYVNFKLNELHRDHPVALKNSRFEIIINSADIQKIILMPRRNILHRFNNESFFTSGGFEFMRFNLNHNFTT